MNWTQTSNTPLTIETSECNLFKISWICATPCGFTLCYNKSGQWKDVGVFDTKDEARSEAISLSPQSAA